jgi:hypothetical protein
MRRTIFCVLNPVSYEEENPLNSSPTNNPFQPQKMRLESKSLLTLSVGKFIVLYISLKNRNRKNLGLFVGFKVKISIEKMC